MSLALEDTENIIISEQKSILHKMENLPEGTALNIALQENVFMLLVCILSKIPIFLVGKPGCSKSLSIQLLRSNLRGKDSPNEFFRRMPQLFCVSFQGSESSTTEGIIKVFEKATKYQEYNDENDVLPVVILDEIGLAEISRFNPLKVLHALLESRSGKHLNIAVVGISNWALDAAKMNRAIYLSRPDMNLKDLMLTGQSICTGMMKSSKKEDEIGILMNLSHNTDLDNIANKLINGIASAYYEYCSSTQKFPNFHGLRDFYSLTKYIGRNMEYILSSEQTKKAEVILIGILRNFSGLPTGQNNMLMTFKKYIPFLTSTTVPVMRLIHENIKDKTGRHLMLITRGSFVISVLERELNEMKLPFDIIFGSNFEEDLNDDYNYRILSRIILCMEQGMVLILKDLEAVYGSLYDMLNQNYTVVSKKKNCRVALGHYSNPMCHVHDNFKCIVLVEESKLDYSDPPFLNRFEKQHFQLTDLLEAEKMQTVVMEVTEEITKFCKIPNYSFSPEDVIPSYSLDLIVSLIVNVSKTVADENIKDYSFKTLLQLLPPEVVVRAKESEYAYSKANFMKDIIGTYLELPIHGGICHFFQNSTLISKITKDISSVEFIESFVIYTYSSLHSIIEDEFTDHKVQKQKLATFKSEKEFTTAVEDFFFSEKSVFLLQCTAASDSEIQQIMLAKDIIEKAIRKYKQTGNTEQSRKYAFLVIHVYRGLYVHLPVNFLSQWKLVFMDTIEKPKTPLDRFLKVDKLEIVRDRMPLHGYITDSLFWVLSKIKFPSKSTLSGSLLEYFLESLRSCEFAIDILEEMIVHWIEKRTKSESSSIWCTDVAKSPSDLILSGTFIRALESNIQDFIRTILAKYIFQMLNQNILTPVIVEDEFTEFRRKSWKNCILSTGYLDIKDIVEPSGPECYSCSNKFLNLRMPFSQVYSQTIENKKDDFLRFVRRRIIEQQIDEDEEIPINVFQDVVSTSFEIICSDAIVIESYPGQNDDYIHDFIELFLSQISIANESKGNLVFMWALSNFIDLSVYKIKQFENLVVALHASVWIYGSVLKAICLIALEPAVSIDIAYDIPSNNESYIFAELAKNEDLEQDSKSIEIADLDRQSFVKVMCLSFLPTINVLKHYKIANWLSKVKQILPLAQTVYNESSALLCLKLCHEISEALFEQKLNVDHYICEIAESLRRTNGVINSPEVCDLIFKTFKDLHQSGVDGKLIQCLFCSYIIRCLKSSNQNVEPFYFALRQITSNNIFDETLMYFGQVFKYALALDASNYSNIFFEFLLEDRVLEEGMPFCKCLNECLLTLNHNLYANMYLPVLVTDILEDVAFSEHLTIYDIISVESGSSYLFTSLTKAIEIVEKGMCGIKTLTAVAYIRNFLKNAVVTLETWKYDCSNKLILAEQINAVLCQRKQTDFVSLLSSKLLHLFLNTIEHVSGQENVETILRKLEKFIPVLKTIFWSKDIMEKMPVYNPLIMHVEKNETRLKEYQSHVLCVLDDAIPLHEILNDVTNSPGHLICVLIKEFYMKKCFGQLIDEDKRKAKAIGEEVKRSDLDNKAKNVVVVVLHVLGLKDFKHSIFDLSEIVEAPVPQMVSLMIHLATMITLNNQENTNTVWGRALFNPPSVKIELPADLPLIIQHIIKLLYYSCLTCSYGFGFANAQSFKDVIPENTEYPEEYLQNKLEESWKYLHLRLEINYFDICLLLHDLICKIMKSENFFIGKTEPTTQNFDAQFISENAAIVEEILENRIEIIHELKKTCAVKNGSKLQQSVLNCQPCNLSVDSSYVEFTLRLSCTSSQSLLLTEIQAGCKNRFKFLTTVVKNMKTLDLPKHLSTLIKWHMSVVTIGTYKFRKVDFKDMTVSSFLFAIQDYSQRTVLENAFKEFSNSWNEIRSAYPILNVVSNCKTESDKQGLQIMHIHSTMKECSIIEDDSFFLEIMKCLAKIQNEFLKHHGVIEAYEKSELRHSLPIQDVKNENLISFKWDTYWEDYCQCDTRYGLGQKMNFYCDMIEKELEQDMLFGKVLIEIPFPLMKIGFKDDLFHNSIELLKEISRKIEQKVLPNEIQVQIRLKKSEDRSYISELLTHVGMTLSLLRKKGLGTQKADIAIAVYLNSLTDITGMSSSVIESLFPEDIRISHSVNLYKWLEELNGESIIETLEDKYRVKLSENAIQCLQETKQNMKHFVKLGHPLKVFAHRCLFVKNNEIRSAQPLNEYLSNKDLWWPGDFIYDDALKKVAVAAKDTNKSLEELLSPLILVENIYDTVKFLTEAIKEAEEKESSFSNMEQTKNERQTENFKKEQGRLVIKKMNRRL